MTQKAIKKLRLVDDGFYFWKLAQFLFLFIVLFFRKKIILIGFKKLKLKGVIFLIYFLKIILKASFFLEIFWRLVWKRNILDFLKLIWKQKCLWIFWQLLWGKGKEFFLIKMMIIIKEWHMNFNLEV